MNGPAMRMMKTGVLISRDKRSAGLKPRLEHSIRVGIGAPVHGNGEDG